MHRLSVADPLLPAPVAMESAFGILLGLLVYVFLVFPTLMILIGCRARRQPSGDAAPSIDVLVAARNERKHIARKIANTLSAAYPTDKLRILIGSDGSRDGTEREVLALDSPRVDLISLPPGTGKAGTINRLVQMSHADLLIISDADVLLDPEAIARLVAPFRDPKIGAVCGRRADHSAVPGTVGCQARLYNLYEGAIKRGEGRIGRVLGGNGSLYAIRRNLFAALPPGVPDDFVSILRVLEKGRRVAYADAALSREELPHSAGCEFVRRRRTTARAVRGMWAVRALLNPFRFPLLFVLLLSHKLLRWSAGLLMIALVGVNLLLLHRPVYTGVLAAQLAFYTAALLGGLNVRGPVWTLFKMARYFVLMNAAATVGLVDVIRGRNWDSWDVQASRGS